MEREGFIAIISPVRDLIFTEKIEACYISSVGAGLAPALYDYVSYYGSGGLGQAQPLLFLFFISIYDATNDRNYYAQTLLFLFFIFIYDATNDRNYYAQPLLFLFFIFIYDATNDSNYYAQPLLFFIFYPC